MIIYLSDFSGFTALQCPMHLGVLNEKKIKVFTYVNVYVSHCSDKKKSKAKACFIDSALCLL